MIVVIEPERLGLCAEKASYRTAPGQTVEVPVQVTRGKGLQGPVKVELVASPQTRGITTTAATIAADQGKGTITLRIPAELRGSFRVPLVLRATLTEKGEPVVAETKLEVLGDE
jgi:hypothetical protein